MDILFKLIVNENLKIYKRPRTWILIAILSMIILYINFIEWNSDGQVVLEQGWQSILKDENSTIDKQLTDPLIPSNEKEDMRTQLQINNYHLDNNISPAIGTMWDGVNGSAGAILIITVFTIIVAGDIVAGEFNTGTIKLLLIRPFNRSKILLSKYISVLIFSMLLIVLLFVISFLTSGFLYGFQDISLPSIEIGEEGNVVEKSMWFNLLMTYLYNIVETIMYVTMAFMISTAFHSGTMAIGFSIGALLGGNIILDALSKYEWTKYLLFANTNLRQYLYDQPFKEGMTLNFSFTILLIYYTLFVFIAWILFTKRDITT